jgi:hypothetical protein
MMMFDVLCSLRKKEGGPSDFSTDESDAEPSSLEAKVVVPSKSAPNKNTLYTMPRIFFIFAGKALFSSVMYDSRSIVLCS